MIITRGGEWLDFIGGSDDSHSLIVSERVVEAIKQSNLKGLVHSLPVEFDPSKLSVKKKRSYEPPPCLYYLVEPRGKSLRGGCHIYEETSPKNLEYRFSVLDGNFDLVRSFFGFQPVWQKFPLMEAWDGNDFLEHKKYNPLYRGGSFTCTRAVKEFAEREGWTNVRFQPIEQMIYGLNPEPPDIELDDLPTTEELVEQIILSRGGNKEEVARALTPLPPPPPKPFSKEGQQVMNMIQIALGVTLPSDYRDALLHYYGLETQEWPGFLWTSADQVIAANINVERSKPSPNPWPGRLYQVGDDGRGGFFFIRSMFTSNGVREFVYLHNPEKDGKIDPENMDAFLFAKSLPEAGEKYAQIVSSSRSASPLDALSPSPSQPPPSLEPLTPMPPEIPPGFRPSLEPISLPAHQLREIEEALQIKLPDYYAQALLNNPVPQDYEWHLIFWTSRDHLIAENTLNRQRKLAGQPWPKELVQIGNDGTGGDFYLRLTDPRPAIYYHHFMDHGELDPEDLDQLHYAHSIPEMIEKQIASDKGDFEDEEEE